MIGAVWRSVVRRKAIVSLILAGAVMAGASTQAAANAKYSAIVIDANTGKTLYSDSADAGRYPASLTKMMTLYMLFDAMASGKVAKTTRIPISAKAAAEAPSKLGLKAGSSITAEQAILALVTKSANDVATAVGEFLGGSEVRFGEMMTRKARSLGMRGTTFRNAHGLPNPAQRTTARDMAILGVALREHHPRYYGYFATRSFVFNGKRIGSHNRVMQRMNTVDGIKTGYIRASGFNLVSSATEGGRKIVAVVMGGKTARSRDDHMVELIRTYLPKASSRGGGALVARGKIEPVAASVATSAAAAVAVAADNEIKLPKSGIPTPDDRPTDSIPAMALAAPAVQPLPVPAPATRTQVAAVRPSADVAPALEETGEGDLDMASTSSISGWVVQVASTGSETEARGVLASVSSRAGRVLANTMPFTEKFEKDGTLFYRARFGGFATKNAAWNACTALKKQKVACYAVQQ